MSKGNIFLGTARGKVGDIVLARRLGEQVARAYVSRVNDANTLGQVNQRAKLGNVVAAYRSLRTLLQKAFENKSSGQTDYNVFASLNLGNSQVALTPAQVSAGACVVAPYRVSRGSLSAIQVIEQTDGEFVSDISVGDLVIGDATTIGELSAAILANNLNWISGDQLSILKWMQAIDPATGFPMAYEYLYEVILDTTNDNVLRDFIPAVAMSTPNGFVETFDPSFVGGIAYIHSRKDSSGKLHVSSQEVMLTNSNSIYARYSSEENRQYVAGTRGYNPGVYLDPTSQLGNSGANPIPPGAPSISVFSLSGVNVLLNQNSQSITPQRLVRVEGANLESDGISILYFNQESRENVELTLTQLVPSPDIDSRAVIEGMAAGLPESGFLLELRAGTTIVKTWPNGWQDPDS